MPPALRPPCRTAVAAVILITSLAALPRAALAQSGDDAASAPLRVVLFGTPGCSKCLRAEQRIEEARHRWGDRIEIVHHDTHEPEGARLLARFRRHYRVSEYNTPMVFVGRQALVYIRDIVVGLDRAIQIALDEGHATFTWSPPQVNDLPEDSAAIADDQLGDSAARTPVDQTQSADDTGNGAAPDTSADTTGAAPADKAVDDESPAAGNGPPLHFVFEAGPVGVALMGLADGVNPCAFTTVVFLISVLSYMGRSRRQVLVVGIGFTAAVFITYVLLGLGLFVFIKDFAVSHGVSAGVTIAIAVIAFALAAWSFVDFVRTLRSGKAHDATLGLPKSVRARINRVIRSGLSTPNLLAGALGVGFAVSVLESLCTGQVYLPTLWAIARSPAMRAASVAYVLLYNLMFILPLVAVMIAAYLGVRSEALAKLMQRHLPWVKLGMALLFVGLGVYVLWTLQV